MNNCRSYKISSPCWARVLYIVCCLLYIIRHFSWKIQYNLTRMKCIEMYYLTLVFTLFFQITYYFILFHNLFWCLDKGTWNCKIFICVHWSHIRRLKFHPVLLFLMQDTISGGQFLFQWYLWGLVTNVEQHGYSIPR